jgi:hypothetical protein
LLTPLQLGDTATMHAFAVRPIRKCGFAIDNQECMHPLMHEECYFGTQPSLEEAFVCSNSVQENTGQSSSHSPPPSRVEVQLQGRTVAYIQSDRYGLRELM